MKYGNAQARQTAIIGRLREAGFLGVAEVARDLGVSEMTVRRDLRQLEATRAVNLVHGGASLPMEERDASFQARTGVDAEAKRRIAVGASTLVGARDAIAIDAGTTTLAMAWQLPEPFAGCVVTHSVPVIDHLMQRTELRLIALGGDLHRPSRAFVGQMTVDGCAGLRVRSLFLGAAAMDERGVYVDADVERPTKLALMAAADRVILLADHSKAGRSAPVLLCGLERISTLVTDARPPIPVGQRLKHYGVEVMIC
ncbi:DeoR/GlpR family DNA-binding transcription regulator [Acidisphaera sp. L21]|uniref:DeoR/GlpR family DNA-binding transcription regulator n=1 Tax=Acidisphaera sp. L21 TaxID=1641851 RepID=UPI00131DDFAB|nr:DeoR/GlpR family DNA-binding transcription regulator [Acidisphaera sp. L21]